MPQDYGVRVLHAYSNMKVGQVIFPPGMLRQQLLQRHLVEEVSPQDYLDEQINDAPVNRAMRTATKRP